MRLTVRVTPRARQRRLEQAAGGIWRANAALIALLAEHFDIPKRSLRIVRGHTGRRKVIEIK